MGLFIILLFLGFHITFLFTLFTRNNKRKYKILFNCFFFSVLYILLFYDSSVLLILENDNKDIIRFFILKQGNILSINIILFYIYLILTPLIPEKIFQFLFVLNNKDEKNEPIANDLMMWIRSNSISFKVTSSLIFLMLIYSINPINTLNEFNNLKLQKYIVTEGKVVKHTSSYGSSKIRRTLWIEDKNKNIHYLRDYKFGIYANQKNEHLRIELNKSYQFFCVEGSNSIIRFEPLT